MSITEAHEAPRPANGSAGFSDAVTFAFGDTAAQVYGIARVGLSGDPATASGLALLFRGSEPVAVRADGGVELDAAASWDDVAAAGVATHTHEPLRSWQVTFTDADGASGFDLRFDALSDPAALGADAPAAKAGGMEAYEQLCGVTGTATVGGEQIAIDGRGQRGHSWGAPDWDRIALARTISAWFDDRGLSIAAIRPSKAKTHADEAVGAFLFEPIPAEGALPVQPVAVAEPLLSTTYDAEGRQLRAGFELYVGEDDPIPHRVAGDVVCGTTLDLGRLRLDCAFFRWHMEGREGIGRYDVLRRT